MLDKENLQICTKTADRTCRCSSICLPEDHSKGQEGSTFESIKIIGLERCYLPLIMFPSCGLLLSSGVSSYLLH